jgi:hypothetical protein
LRQGTTTLPREALDAAVPIIPPGGSIAVARANHPGRFLSLVSDQDGSPVAFVKVARDTAGAEAIAREREALERWAPLLSSPLHAPVVLDHADGVLILEPVLWRPRMDPWTMPVEVAQALGSFFRATASGGYRTSGVAHGDCAPWNLLRDERGWALIDWENASDEMPPFYDLFHFLVQSSVELRRPSKSAILEGLRLNRPVGDTVAAYADGAGVDPREARSYFWEYLRRSAANIEPGAPGRAARIRRNLRDRARAGQLA